MFKKSTIDRGRGNSKENDNSALLESYFNSRTYWQCLFFLLEIDFDVHVESLFDILVTIILCLGISNNTRRTKICLNKNR